MKKRFITELDIEKFFNTRILFIHNFLMLKILLLYKNVFIGKEFGMMEKCSIIKKFFYQLLNNFLLFRKKRERKKEKTTKYFADTLSQNNLPFIIDIFNCV